MGLQVNPIAIPSLSPQLSLPTVFPRAQVALDHVECGRGPSTWAVKRLSYGAKDAHNALQ